MKKWIYLLLGATALSAVTMVGCTGDDAIDQPVNDGGQTPDGNVLPDGGPKTDSGDGGGACDFAVFVTGLIKNQTSATSVPSTDLGANCTDKRDQTQFAPLFQ